jgi:hypothetical protein
MKEISEGRKEGREEGRAMRLNRERWRESRRARDGNDKNNKNMVTEVG